MHMMFDLETLGTKPGCVVLSIGAVMFDPYDKPNDLGGVNNFPHTLTPTFASAKLSLPSSGAPQYTFYREIDILSSLVAGLIIEPDTLAFWKKKTDEKPIGDFFPIEKTNLFNVVTEFHMWATMPTFGPPPLKVWAKSPDFDCAIWEHTAALFSAPVPWSFRDKFDVRTAEFMGQLDTKTIPREGTHHNALDDAKFQAKCIQIAMKVG